MSDEIFIHKDLGDNWYFKGDTIAATRHPKDGGLSVVATCILFYLVAKPEGWKTNLKDIKSRLDGMGDNKVRDGIKELCVHGYAKRCRFRDGKKWRYETHISARPTFNPLDSTAYQWTDEDFEVYGFGLAEFEEAQIENPQNGEVYKEKKVEIKEEEKEKKKENNSLPEDKNTDSPHPDSATIDDMWNGNRFNGTAKERSKYNFGVPEPMTEDGNRMKMILQTAGWRNVEKDSQRERIESLGEFYKTVNPRQLVKYFTDIREHWCKTNPARPTPNQYDIALEKTGVLELKANGRKKAKSVYTKG